MSKREGHVTMQAKISEMYAEDRGRSHEPGMQAAKIKGKEMDSSLEPAERISLAYTLTLFL